MAFRTMSRLVSLAFLITSVVAVAMPMPRPQALSKNCEQCLSLIATSKRCGYDILSGDYTTVTELTCLCGIYSFVYEYKACIKCGVTMGEISATEAVVYIDAMETGCSSIPSSDVSGNGVESLAIGSGQLIFGAAFAAGLAYVL